MKKLIASILCACMISSLLIGCGGDGGNAATNEPANETETDDAATTEQLVLCNV